MGNFRGNERRALEPGEPVLLFKVGVFGALPLDTMPELARNLGAAYVSNDEVRKGIIDAALRKTLELAPDAPVTVQDLYVSKGPDFANRFMDRQTRIPLAVLREGVGSKVMPLIGSGVSVVNDGFYNQPPTREWPGNWAHAYGANVAAVVAHTSERGIRQRVKEWTEQDALPVPVEYYNRPPQAIVADMLGGGVSQPLPGEAIDLTIHVDGNGTTPEIVSGIMQQLGQAGLDIRL